MSKYDQTGNLRRAGYSVCALVILCHLGAQPAAAQMLEVGAPLATALPSSAVDGTAPSVVDLVSITGTTVAVLARQASGSHVYLLDTSALGEAIAHATLDDAVNATAITNAGDTALHVLDAWGPAVIRVNVTPNGELEPSPSIRLPLVAATDLCVSGDRLLVLGADAPISASAVHEFSSDYRLTGAFGSSWAAWHGSTPRPGYAAGKISCHAPRESVIVASLLHPDVRAYGADRRLLWDAEMPGFLAVRVEFQDPAGVAYRLPDGDRWDRVIGISAVAGDLVAVQVERQSGSESRSGRREIMTHLFDAPSGELLASQADLPAIAGTVPEANLALVQTDLGQEGTRPEWRPYRISERQRR